MKIETNYNLTPHNSYGIRSFCSQAFFPETFEDFESIFIKNTNERRKIVIGGGNNIIFSKDYYREDFIIIGSNFSMIRMLGDNELLCQAGTSTKELCEFALNHELKGAEMFYDIPSSMGGAVVMNAGASGEEIKDILVKVEYFDIVEKKIKEISKEEIGFQYRNSYFQNNPDTIVLNVFLQLKRGKKDEIKNKMLRTKENRRLKQPRKYPNAGSVFKRPEGFYVGTLIEELDLKGLTVGGAMVSKKHGGFIINYNNATGRDILDLIVIIKEKVKKSYNIELEVEQRII